ncbi:MAG: nucleotidyltransferase domain-containing protein [Spirochaetales bacterium]|nr:nucleotidyltransferase domain-containing protein [Spirochaetales bacterium]
MKQKDIINKLEQYFSDKQQFDTVLLFGSYSNNKYNEQSDVDIAVHGQQILSLDQILDIKVELSRLLKKEIDLVDLHKCKGVFLHQIMTNNIRIRCDSDICQKYLMTALTFMEYEYPTIKWLQEEKIRRFLHEYHSNQ